MRIFNWAKRFKFWGKPKKPKLDFRGLKGDVRFKAKGPMDMEAGKGRTFTGKQKEKE
ncbi:hypothetical protein IIC68_02150 [archaeon]|nr:hypothetical protein [archaeon]